MFTWVKRKTGFQPGGLQWNSGYVAGWWLSTLKSSEVPSDFKKERNPCRGSGLFWTHLEIECLPSSWWAAGLVTQMLQCQLWGGGRRGRKQRRRTLRSFFVNYLQVLTYICVRTVFPLMPNPTSHAPAPPRPLLPEASNSGEMGLGKFRFLDLVLIACDFVLLWELCCKISHSIYDYVHIFH